MVEVLAGRRVVASPSYIDHAVWPAGALVLRIAPDDVLVVGEGTIEINDPHAIVEVDGGFCGVRTTEEYVMGLMARAASWRLPDSRPCLAQGMVVGLPVKICLEGGEVWVIVPTPFAHELEARLI